VDDLAQIATDIENSAESGDLPGCAGRMDALRAEFARVQKFLAPYLPNVA